MRHDRAVDRAAGGRNTEVASMVPRGGKSRAPTLYSMPMLRLLVDALSGIDIGVRARKTVFGLVALTVFVMDIVVPPIVLSLARKPVDYFTFNPWLKRLPEFLT